MKKPIKIISISLILIVVAIIVSILILNLSTPEPINPKQTEIANPSATYCIEQGHEYKIRNTEDGSQSGVCIFSNGKECGAWEFFRGGCLE